MRVDTHISLPPYDDREIYRYMGADADTNSVETAELLDQCKRECEQAHACAAVYEVYEITIRGDKVSFGNFTCKSRDLAKCLAGCDHAIVFVATVGFTFDRLIKKYSALSPARALVISAIGTERVEALCDTLCTAWSRKYGVTRPRYGIGYGDLSLKCQREIFDHLDVTHHIGVTLTRGMLMSPTKSVSAIVGIPTDSSSQSSET